ncbi:MAG: ATP-binding cassette domain-containing protein [Treponema sp.]|nr:ATP-binding cassette domain-containing protein [Treponema sp.]
MNTKPFIQIDNIRMWYPYKKGVPFLTPPSKRKWVKAVDGVSFNIEEREILGVIGESGCGKSTLGRALARLENPTSGDVFIDGVSTSKMLSKNQKEFRRNVQIIFQNPFDTFTPRDTIAQILLRPLKNHSIGENNAQRIEMCLNALDSYGLRPAEDIMERHPHELSGGQLQRISIIRSMFMNPRFVIADEPVSMLDVSVRSDIINMLLLLREEKGASIVFISHDISLTRYISDKIAVLYLGRVVEYGLTDEVISNPKHPYAQALISNCGSIDPDDDTVPIDIQGEPPTPVNPGPGCYFAPRCHIASDKCFTEYPDFVNITENHYAACFKTE